jgi:hypothetical protein
MNSKQYAPKKANKGGYMKIKVGDKVVQRSSYSETIDVIEVTARTNKTFAGRYYTNARISDFKAYDAVKVAKLSQITAQIDELRTKFRILYLSLENAE